MKRILAIAALSAALISPALAQVCVSPDRIISDIEKHDMALVWAGLAGPSQTPLYLFLAPSGKWILFAPVDGAACVFGDGVGGTLVEDGVAGDPA